MTQYDTRQLHKHVSKDGAAKRQAKTRSGVRGSSS